jgi:hypothetical protein
LYHNPTIGKWQYLRHDYDVSYGTMVLDYNTMDMYTWANTSRGHRLINRVLAVPTFVQTYTNYMHQLLDSYFYPNGSLMQRAFALRDFLKPLVQRDSWFGLDLSWSQQQFASNYESTIYQPGKSLIPPFNNATITGIEEYIQIRYDSLRKQIKPAKSSSTGGASVSPARSIPIV